MCNLNKKCREIYDYLNQYLDDKFETMTDKSKFLDENLILDKTMDVSVAFKGMTKKFKENELHFFRAFPYFRSTKYNDLLSKIKVLSRKKKDK